MGTRGMKRGILRGLGLSDVRIPALGMVMAAMLSGCATTSASAGGEVGKDKDEAQKTEAVQSEAESGGTLDLSDGAAHLSAAQRMDELCRVLDDNKLKYFRDNEKGRVMLDFSVPNSLKRVRCVLRCREDGLLVNATVEAVAEDIGARYSVMEFITRLNFMLRHGDFELDLSDGQLVYKTYTLYDGDKPVAPSVVMRNIAIPVAMFKDHGETLFRLMQGQGEAKAEFEKTMEEMK